MSLLTRAGDLLYTFRFLKLLVTKWKDTDAFKLGIIDDKGKRIKSKSIVTSEEKSSFTSFHKLVFNIKKLLEKVPGGSSALASYAAALFLLKEQFGVSDKNIEKILKESEIDVLSMMSENNKWFLMENSQLSPGIYRVKNEKVINETLDELIMPKDRIRVLDNSFPIGDLFGINIYEGLHLNTGKSLYFTLGEVYK